MFNHPRSVHFMKRDFTQSQPELMDLPNQDKNALLQLRTLYAKL